MNQVVLFSDSLFEYGRPLGIYLLATHLRKYDITVKPIWGWTHITFGVFKLLCHKFIDKNTVAVGISSTLLIQNSNNNFFGISYDNVKQRIELIKTLSPDCKIIVGGSQTTYNNLLDLPERPLIDIFVQGQGEQAIVDIVDAIIKKNRIKTESIDPVITSDKIYKYTEFSKSFPKILESDVVINGEALAIEFARGCIFKCSFCSYELNGKKSGDYIKGKSVLRDELLRNYEIHGIKDYYSTDDLINDSEEKVDAILETFQSLPFKITFSGYLRLDLLRRFPTMAMKLKEAGLVACFFGIETINAASGKSVGKGLGIERITQAIAICDNAWNNTVAATGAFILGLPHDNKESAYELSEWLSASAIKRVIKDVVIQPLHIDCEFGLSDIDKDPSKFGYKFISDNSVNFRSRTTTALPTWYTSDYTFSQARIDSNYVSDQFYKDIVFKKRVDPAGIPYLLSFAENKQDVLDVILTDTSLKWKSNEDWSLYITQLNFAHREQYIKKLLSLTN